MKPAKQQLLIQLYESGRKHDEHAISDRQFLLGLAMLAAILVLVLVLAPHAHAAENNTCVDCHSAMDAPLKVTTEQFAQDIHAQKGLTCASCHGGDPNIADENAMSAKAGFKGKVTRDKIPEMCARCHSDAAYMRQYNPSLRTDQLAQYKTSVHGKRLFEQHDTKVAVCTDCHGVHGLRAVSDPRSKVHPLNVATTCAKCHSDTKYMQEYKIPTEQFAAYSSSVHAEAMNVRGDLSAPTCTTCHGNHGATPPGVASVANVCANCHVFQAQLFEKSPHKAAFAQADLPGCVTCHSNHRILHPNDTMVGTSPEATCTRCHTQGDAGYTAAGSIHESLTKLQGSIDEADRLIGQAEQSGMEVSQPKLDMDQARDGLTKARVSVHLFQTKGVEQDVQAGMKIAQKGQDAGRKALAERDYRRIGLAMSLMAIVLALVGLKLYIKEVDQRQ